MPLTAEQIVELVELVEKKGEGVALDAIKEMREVARTEYLEQQQRLFDIDALIAALKNRITERVSHAYLGPQPVAEAAGATEGE